MKCIIDVQPLTSGSYTGIPYYSYRLLDKLISTYDEDYLITLFDSGKTIEHYDKICCLTGNNRMLINHDSNRLYRLLNLAIPLSYSKRFERADVAYFCSYFLPRNPGMKSVFTIYDMVYKTHPGTMRTTNAIILSLELKRSAKKADHIITISESSKREIMEYLNVPEEKITIVYPAYDRDRFNADYDKEDISDCCKKFGIEGDFILYVGTLEPRKNIVRLIQAYEKAFSGRENAPQLVLAGGKGWKYEEIFQTAEKCSLKDKIVFTGYVDDRDVPLLMNAATVFVFPSIYEGFGMPCLEAMACGTPVVTSNVTSMPEVVEDAGVLVDPYSIDDIASKLSLLMDNPDIRYKCISLGLTQCQKFSWEKSADKLHEVLKSVAAK